MAGTTSAGTAGGRTAARAPEERRRRILEATVAVIRDRGFAGTRVIDIAGAAGTSSGLVLYHFGSLAGALTQSLTHVEDAFYGELETELESVGGPVERLRRMAELASEAGPAVGDWTLWLELWVRALRDEDARATRESLDRRWRSALRRVVVEGVAAGVFHPADVAATTLRLSSLMDGLAIQLALAEPGMTAARFRRLWLDSAALELGVPTQAFRGRAARSPRRRAAS
jgi:AcrR family transcriptional regulator